MATTDQSKEAALDGSPSNPPNAAITHESWCGLPLGVGTAPLVPERPAAKRHPATWAAWWAAWKWLEQGEGKDRSAEEREYLAEKITELDRLLFELDEGSAYVV